MAVTEDRLAAGIHGSGKEDHMQNGESRLISLGSTTKERFEKLIEIAKELCREKYIEQATWRSVIASHAASVCEAPGTNHAIYAFMNALGRAKLAELREICIGKAASDEMMRKYHGCRQKSPPSVDPVPKIAGTLEEVVASLPTSMRTIRGVAEASGKQVAIVVSYAYNDAAFRRSLLDGSKVFDFCRK